MKEAEMVRRQEEPWYMVKEDSANLSGTGTMMTFHRWPGSSEARGVRFSVSLHRWVIKYGLPLKEMHNKAASFGLGQLW
jgi:hypothetical protein